MGYLSIGKGGEVCHCSLRKDLKGLTGAFYGSKMAKKLSGFFIHSHLYEKLME